MLSLLANIKFCGNSTCNNELKVKGLLANVGIGIVPLFCLSSLVNKIPVLVPCGTDPCSLCVSQECCKRTQAHASGATRSKTTNDSGAERPEIHKKKKAQKTRNPKQRLGLKFQKVRKGRKKPTSPNLPSAAFPDFQGDAGEKFFFFGQPWQRQNYVCAQWIC